MSVDVALLDLAQQCGIEFVDGTAPTPGRCATRDHVRLSFLDWGGDAEPIIFLHGGALTAHTWDLVCLGLRDRYRCVALDLRGHGDSDWADDYSIETAVEDVAALASLIAQPRCHLVGMSLGGIVAAHYAAKHPTRTASLTLVDVGPGIDFAATQSLRDFVAQTDVASSMEAAIAAALKINPHADPNRIAYRLRHSTRQAADGTLAWKLDRRRPHDYAHILEKVAQFPIIASRIECPVLVVRGARSRIFSDAAAAGCATLFARGEWNSIPDAGHSVQEDNPAGLVDALMLFL